MLVESVLLPRSFLFIVTTPLAYAVDPVARRWNFVKADDDGWD